MKEILEVVILSICAILSTYGFSKGLWLVGIQGKEKSFKKLWLAVSCFFVSIATATVFILLAIKF